MAKSPEATLDSRTKREIDRLVKRVLQDSGFGAPPIDIDEVVSYLKLSKDYYSLDDPSLLQDFRHKLRIGKHTLINIAKKIRLAGLWLPDRRKILIDENLPPPKKKWAALHEALHSILPWHQAYFLGDTAQELDPDFQEALEAEANYGASALLFCGEVFSRDALDTIPEWSSVFNLSKKYRSSLVSTLRRYVEHSHSRAMAMIVSKPWWQKKPSDQTRTCRYFIRSQTFLEYFREIPSQQILAEIHAGTRKRRGGIVGDFPLHMRDDNGEMHGFRAQSFYNGYDILTLLVHAKRLTARHVAIV